jgi:hypothetical protein
MSLDDVIVGLAPSLLALIGTVVSEGEYLNTHFDIAAACSDHSATPKSCRRHSQFSQGRDSATYQRFGIARRL